VSSGVRRIEALTGEAARLWFEHQAGLVRDAAAALKAAPAELIERITALAEDRRRLERELSDAKRKLALAGPAAAGGDELEEAGFGHSVACGASVAQTPQQAVDARVDGMKKFGGAVKAASQAATPDEAKAKLGSGIVAFVTDDGGKASIVVGVTADLTGTYDAVALVRAANEKLGGKGGGGRPDMAQAGGPDPSRSADALEAIRAALRSNAA
jgi:alanyl-tRNA synthetase